ncbi:IS3 family transposase [Paenibacillus faecalis]
MVSNNWGAFHLKDVRNYIRYYNNDRYTERLNGLSPNEYRKQAAIF